MSDYDSNIKRSVSLNSAMLMSGLAIGLSTANIATPSTTKSIARIEHSVDYNQDGIADLLLTKTNGRKIVLYCDEEAVCVPRHKLPDADNAMYDTIEESLDDD